MRELDQSSSGLTRVFGLIDQRKPGLDASRSSTTTPAQIVWGDVNMWTADQQIVWGDQLFNPAASRSCGAIRSINPSGQQIVWGDQVYNPGGQQIVWGDTDTSGANQIVWGDSIPHGTMTRRLPARRRRVRRCVIAIDGCDPVRRVRGRRCHPRHTRASGPSSRVLALMASRFPLRIPGSNAWFSISDTFFMTSALLFGPGPATIIDRDRQHG